MKRWIAAFLGLLLTMGMTAGCGQKCFISEKDFYARNMLPTALEDGDSADLVQPTNDPSAAPPTVDNPDRPARHLSLQEAIAIALENGATGNRNGGANTTGTIDDSSLSSTGGSLNGQSDRMRVLALQPAITGAAIEAALARFDALWVSSLGTLNTDVLPSSGIGVVNNNVSSFNTGIVKALSGGGIASASFENDYTLFPPGVNAGLFSNPIYSSRLRLGFEQPLLRNFGTDVNQLLNRVPSISGAGAAGGSTNSGIPAFASGPFATQQGNLGAVNGTPVEGILITRLRFDQQRAEFERQVHNLLLNVEVAYWNLYSAYGALYSNEEVLRVLHKLWMDTYIRAQAGSEKAPPDVLAVTRAQFEEFRGERTNALATVLEAERSLRGFLGLPVEDGTRLIPVTPPTLAPFQPNWDAALNDALTHRPELVLARENLRFHQLALAREKNSLKPDLRFVAQYQPAGFGKSLSGSGTFVDALGRNVSNNALADLASNHFDDYFIGLNLSVPLGYRFEHASVRTARLQLAQAYHVLKDQEDKVKRTLTQQYQGLNKWYRLIEDRRAERRGYAEALTTKYTLVALSKKTVDLDILDNQRRLALALTKEYQAIAEYNNSLARVEFARGTIMQHENVVIAENGLTPCAQVRAVEHERERTRALVLCERPDPLTQPAMLAGNHYTTVNVDSSTMPATMGEGSGSSKEPPVDELQKAPAPGVDGAPAPLPLIPDAPAFLSDGGKPAIAPLPQIDIPPMPKSAPPPAGAKPSVAPPPALPDLSGGKETPIIPVAPAAAPPPPLLPDVAGTKETPVAPVVPATAPAVAPPSPATGANSVDLPPPPPIPDVINEPSSPPTLP